MADVTTRAGGAPVASDILINADQVTIKGNGSLANPLYAVTQGPGGVVEHDNTLDGDGTSESPLGATGTLPVLNVAGLSTLNGVVNVTTQWTSGAGSPEGSVLGGVGDLYSQTDGVGGAVLWLKATGSGNDTGWTPALSSVVIDQTLYGVGSTSSPLTRKTSRVARVFNDFDSSSKDAFTDISGGRPVLCRDRHARRRARCGSAFDGHG